MSRLSPHMTRRRKKLEQDIDDDDSDISVNYPHTSLGSDFYNDSKLEFDDSRDSSNFSSPTLSHLIKKRSVHTSCSSSSSSLYPELNSSADVSFNKSKSERDFSYESKAERKQKRIYPILENDKKSNDGNCPWIVVFVAILSVIFVVCLVTRDSTASVNSSDSSLLRYELFENHIKSLQNSFPNQTKRFWGTIMSSARHVFEQRDPCYPSVILLASHKKNQKLSVCVARKIAATFSASRGIYSKDSLNVANVNDFKHLGPDDQKKWLDSALQSAFQHDGIKGFVISNVHALSPTAALLLHGFCDGDNAPYQDVMMLLTFHVADSTVFHSVRQVEDFLMGMWSPGLHMDKLTALMSRIANNPVVLMSEDANVVNELC